MNKLELAEHVKEISNELSLKLNSYIGEKIDVITIAGMENDLRQYFRDLVAIRYISDPIDFSKIGICSVVSDFRNGEIKCNEYTQSLFEKLSK
jgi:hypothetical protein